MSAVCVLRCSDQVQEVLFPTLLSVFCFVLFCFYHERVLDFVKCCFYVYGDNHMVLPRVSRVAGTYCKLGMVRHADMKMTMYEGVSLLSSLKIRDRYIVRRHTGLLWGTGRGQLGEPTGRRLHCGVQSR